MLVPFHDDNPTTRAPIVTLAIVAVNATVLYGVYRLPPDKQAMLFYARGFVPARIAQLFDGKPLEIEVREPAPRLGAPDLVRIRRIALPPSPRQILLSLLTCMFLHGGWMHFIGNMWFLWLFGNNVEDRLGHVPFLFFYLVGGLLASACHWITGPGSTAPVIGASGAVAAVLGAYAITWPWARVRSLLFLFIFVTIVDLPALLVLGVWFLMQLASATATADLQLGGGVAWWAHVGGFLAGLVVMPLLDPLRAEHDEEIVVLEPREDDDEGYF